MQATEFFKSQNETPTNISLHTLCLLLSWLAGMQCIFPTNRILYWKGNKEEVIKYLLDVVDIDRHF